MTHSEENYQALVREALQALDEAKEASDRGDAATYNALLNKSVECSERARALWQLKSTPPAPAAAEDKRSRLSSSS